MSELNILIAGGTGFIGQALVKDRLNRGDKVTVLGRNRETIKTKFAGKVNELTWYDLGPQHLEKFDVVINLAGANISERKWTPRRKQEIIASRVNSTHKIATYCAQLGELSPRLLNASAIGIYGVEGTTEQDEKSTIAHNPYSDFSNQVGYLWEEACTPATQANVNVVNMRFGVVLAPQGGMLKKLLPVYTLGLGGRVGSGQQIISWVSLADVISAIDFLIQHPDISGPVNIVAPEAINQQNFARSFAKSLHRPCFMPLPSMIVKLLYGKMGEELLLKGKKIKPTKLLQLNYQFCHATLTDFLNQPKEKM